MSNVTYSFVGDSSKNELAFESKVSSFGLDHITKKDLVSFYLNFSTQAHFDTGLLPVDGSGILSIRTAGNHTQIGYQHAPGMYYINWGSYEKDPNAQKIYVAQPYRIVIADLHNGNILGARTFYSPVPIQHPAAQLYHVNLPNINCKGYRGNGVGWICLYHTEDITSYPFNEKVAKILERCSGVEAYNDQNMSETDGPRFYQQNNKPSYLWNPNEWQDHSSKFDLSWTLDPDLWIPVLVNHRDDQDRHVADGVPLTYADAILGNYQAYYSDPIKPKLINKIAREDLTVSTSDIFNIFKMTYNSSQEFGSKLISIDPLNSSLKVREQLSKVNIPPITNNENEHNENIYFCDCCESQTFDVEHDEYTTLHSGELYCNECSSEHVVFVDHMQSYFHREDEELYFIHNLDSWIFLPNWNSYLNCNTCGSAHPYDMSKGYMPDMVPIYEKKDFISCNYCTSTIECAMCNNKVVPLVGSKDYGCGTITKFDTFDTYYVCNYCKHNMSNYIEKCSDFNAETILTCLCGCEDKASNFKLTSVSFQIFYDTNLPLHKLITKNYNIVSHSESFDLSDPTIAHTDYKKNHYDNILSSPHFKSYHVLINRMCNTCYTEKPLDQFKSSASLRLTEMLQDADLCEKLASTQSDRKIAGLYIACQNTF